jgi:hypothetical protein
MSWRDDYKKWTSRLKKRKRAVELLLIGPPPDAGELKAATTLLESTIASARKVTRHKKAGWGANIKRRKKLQRLNKDAKKVYDRALALLAALPTITAEDKLPEAPVQQTIITTPVTFYEPSAPPEDELLAIVSTDGPSALEMLAPLPEESFVQRHPVLVGLGVLTGVGAVIGGVYYFTTREEG